MNNHFNQKNVANIHFFVVKLQNNAKKKDPTRIFTPYRIFTVFRGTPLIDMYFLKNLSLVHNDSASEYSVLGRKKARAVILFGGGNNALNTYSMQMLRHFFKMKSAAAGVLA